jgi:hypothetical protein
VLLLKTPLNIAGRYCSFLQIYNEELYDLLRDPSMQCVLLCVCCPCCVAAAAGGGSGGGVVVVVVVSLASCWWLYYCVLPLAIFLQGYVMLLRTHC